MHLNSVQITKHFQNTAFNPSLRARIRGGAPSLGLALLRSADLALALALGWAAWARLGSASCDRVQHGPPLVA